MRQSDGCQSGPSLWTDAEVAKHAAEYIHWWVDSSGVLDAEDWWSEDHDGEIFLEENLVRMLELIRASKIIIKHGR